MQKFFDVLNENGTYSGKVESILVSCYYFNIK